MNANVNLSNQTTYIRRIQCVSQQVSAKYANYEITRWRYGVSKDPFQTSIKLNYFCECFHSIIYTSCFDWTNKQRPIYQRKLRISYLVLFHGLIWQEHRICRKQREDRPPVPSQKPKTTAICGGDEDRYCCWMTQIGYGVCPPSQTHRRCTDLTWRCLMVYMMSLERQRRQLIFFCILVTVVSVCDANL